MITLSDAVHWEFSSFGAAAKATHAMMSTPGIESPVPPKMRFNVETSKPPADWSEWRDVQHGECVP